MIYLARWVMSQNAKLEGTLYTNTGYPEIWQSRWPPPNSSEDTPTNTQMCAGIVYQRVLVPLSGVRAAIIDGTPTPLGLHLHRAKKMGESIAAIVLLGTIGRELLQRETVYASQFIPPIAILAHRLYSPPNTLRKWRENIGLHPSQKLNLTPLPITETEMDADMRLCVAKLNTLEYQTNPKETINSEAIIQCMSDAVKKLYGFATPITHRPKKVPHLPNGIRGWMDHNTGEIMIGKDDKHYAFPHEIAHALGIRKESEAEFFTTMALIRSGDERLQALGYQRLFLQHINARMPSWLMAQMKTRDSSSVDMRKIYRETITDHMKQLGLSDNTILNLLSMWRIDEPQSTYHSAPKVRLNSTRSSASVFSRISRKLQEVFGGRPDGRWEQQEASNRERYALTPLRLMHDYWVKNGRPPLPSAHTDDTPH